jgi:hypothetical protein
METFGNKKKCPFFGFKNWLTGLHHKSLEVPKKIDCIAPFCSFLLLLLLFKTLREPWGQHIGCIKLVILKGYFYITM